MFYKTDGSAPPEACDYNCGTLPECAPLAAAFVPMQGKNPPQYAPAEALTKGTLFPGLDLPFKNTANKSYPYAGTPMGELMELQFMMKEMQLYLDTHPDDKEVFAALKKTIALFEKGKKTYAQMFGPVTLSDVQYSEKFNWSGDPWPWEYDEKARK